MTITGIGGKLSGGKTCFAMALLKDDSEKTRKIISNIPVYGLPNAIYMTSEQFVDFIIEHRHDQKKIEQTFLYSSILMDEVRGVLSARKSSSNLAETVTTFCMMLNKLDANFYYTYQVFGSQVDLQLREITDFIMECTRVDARGIPFIGPRIPYVTPNGEIVDKNIAGPDDKPFKIYTHVQPYQVISEGLKPIGKGFVYDPEPFFKYYNTRDVVIVDREKYLRR